jgi:hypothetical protein
MKIILFILLVLNICEAKIRNIECPSDMVYFDLYEEIDVNKCFTYSVDQYSYDNGLYETCCCKRGYELIENICVLKKCECNNDKQSLALLGMLAAPLVLPSMAAATGLYGAAAFTNGLAAFGGGAIANGGLGMFGGQIVTSLIGKSVGEKVADYSNDYCVC